MIFDTKDLWVMSAVTPKRTSFSAECLLTARSGTHRADNILFSSFGTIPFNNRHGFFYVKEPLLTGFKAVACEHFFWSPRRYFRKYRSPTRQAHSRRA
jgi:hypothetical protein